MESTSTTATAQNAQTGAITALVREENIERVTSKLKQLAKRAEKLGLPPLEFTIGEPQERLGEVHTSEQCRVVVVFPVSVAHRVVGFDGWRLLAAIDNVDGAPLIRAVPSQVVPPTARSVDPAWCDHCRASRRRLTTYLLQHDDGRTKQVGGNCLVDFLGHQDAALVALYGEIVMEVASELTPPTTSTWSATSPTSPSSAARSGGDRAKPRSSAAPRPLTTH